MRKFNVKLFLILMAGVVVLGGALFGVHYLQYQRIAHALLFQANRAEEQGNKERLATYLQRYLEFAPQDVAEKKRLGLVWTSDTFAARPRLRLRGFNLLNEVLIREPNQPEVRKAVLRIALHPTTLQPKVARDQLQTLWQEAQQPGAAVSQQDRGELESYWGQFMEVEQKPIEAMDWYEQARTHNPKEPLNYIRLASLLRTQPEIDAQKRDDNYRQADTLIDTLVKADEDSYKPKLTRWNYRREFDLLRDPGMTREQQALLRRYAPGEAGKTLTEHHSWNEALLKQAAQDIEASIKAAPEELEVLLAAADMERLKGALSLDADAAEQHRHEARAFLQLGLQLQKKPGYGSVSEQAKFQLLWHLANLLLDSAQIAQKSKASAPKAVNQQKIDEAAEAITQMRQLRTLPPGAADYLEGRLFCEQHKWAEAAARFTQARPLLAQRGELAYDIDLQLNECYQKLEQPGLVVTAAERAIKFNPNSAMARLSMGSALWTQGRQEEALKYYQMAMDQNQVPPEGWMDIARLQVLIQLGRENRDWKEAEAALDRAAQATPNLIEVKLLRAEVFAAQKKFQEAEEYLVKELNDTPNEIELWVARAGLAEHDQNVEGAKAVLKAAKLQLGDRVELRLARARMAVRLHEKEIDTVLAAMEQSWKSFKPAEQSKLLDGLAEAYYLTDNLAKARELWTERARLKMNHDDLRLRLLLFDLSVKANDAPAMDETLNDIASIEGKQGVYYRFGQAVRLIWLARQDKVENKTRVLNEARLLLDQAAGVRPAWSRISLARAEIEEMRGNPEEAISYLKKTIEQGENSPIVVKRLVDALQQRQRYAEAAQEMERQSKSQLVNSELGQMAANVALRQGNTDRALQLAKIAVDPNSKNFRDQLWQARLLFVAKKDREAFAKFQQALALADTEPEPYVGMVQFLTAQGRGDEAVAVVNEAKKKLPPEKAALALAQCYEALGLAKEAGNCFELAIQQTPSDVSVLRTAAGFYLKTGRMNEVVPILRIVAEGRVTASADNVEWARRGLAIVLAASMEYAQFKEALGLVGLKLDEHGQLVREESYVDSTDAMRAKARVLATQPGQRQFRERAIDLLEQLGRRGSLLPDDKYILALLYDSANTWPKSREQLKELTLPIAQGEQPRYLTQAPQYMNRYVQGLIRNNDTEEAGRALDRLDAIEKQQGVKEGSFGTVELRAQLLERTRQGDKAVSLLTAYAKRHPNTKDMILLVVGSLVRQQRFDEALTLLEKDIDTCQPEMAGAAYVSLLHEIKPTDDQCRRAETWLKGHLERVEQEMQQKADPRQSERLRASVTMLRQHLANLYDLRGRYPESEAMYRRILQDHQTNVLALNNLSWLLAQRTGDGPAALELIDRAITNMGRRADLLDTRGIVYLALNEPDKALADFKEAASDERTPTRLFHLARAHFAAKDRATALKVLLDAKSAGLEPSKLHPVEQLSCRELLTELKVQ